MSTEKRKHKFTLILLISAIIFCIIAIAVLIAGAITGILLRRGMIEPVSGKPNARYVLLLMGALSLTVGAVLTVLIGRIISGPLNRIVDRMNRLAGGDYSARLQLGRPICAHPTFARLTDSFNKMAQELESTEMLRSDFINNFSHEFKTPIVSIAGFAKLLKRGNLTEAQKREYIDVIEAESMRLAQMATNVLTLTKYENQAILTDVTAFNLSEQVRASILALEGKWSKKRIDFNLAFDEYTIRANRDMLKHVWINLIDNAVKFSPDGGTVEIAIHLSDGIYTATVQNQGPAIPAEQQEKIFRKFYQADESHASEGNGIGLALVKSITKLHGGDVSVQCEGGVTVFTVTLPAEPPADA